MGHITLDTIRAIQRDHFEGESIAPRWSPADGLQVTICMHAMLDTASKTAASSHVELVEGETPVWWSAFGCPCLSVYAPYSVNNALPAELSCAGAKYTPESAWWQFERLQYALSRIIPATRPSGRRWPPGWRPSCGSRLLPEKHPMMPPWRQTAG